jgi:hypothetical protein
MYKSFPSPTVKKDGQTTSKSSRSSLIRHPNEHRRNTDLGIVQPAPADPRRDRAGDAGALVSGKDGLHGAGLASPLWPPPRERVFTPRLWLRSAALLWRWWRIPNGGVKALCAGDSIPAVSRLLNDAPDNAIVFDPTVYHDTHYKFHLSRRDIVHLVRSCLFSRHGDRHLLPYQPGRTSRNLSQ